jgi:outer membrane protein assembly factor BamD
MKRSLAILALLLVAGCASTSFDETKNWGPERIYSAAREELENKNYQ